MVLLVEGVIMKTNQYHLLTDFMGNIPDQIYIKDTKGKFIFVNKAYAKGLGLDISEILGKTESEFFPGRQAERLAKEDQDVMRAGRSIVNKIEKITKGGGAEGYVSVTKIPRQGNNGRMIGLIGITRDMTKQMKFERLRGERLLMERKLEMLESLNKVKTEFISSVSHELRTPLAIIKQLLSLMYDETIGPISDQQREVLVKARYNIERLKNIIDEMLDLSRIEGKGISLRYSLVNMNDLLKESQGFYRELAGEKNISLSYQLPKTDVNIFIDAERIIQCVTNLINNAIKFTRENGKIKVEVQILETKVRIGVIDTGIGIAKSDLSKVFGKFVQVSHFDNAERKGIGLGLSIVKEIVEKHGGEIWIESKLGAGSKIYFTLPRFYTADVLGVRVKEKINHLLGENKSVHLINLLVVNFEEFKKRIDLGPGKLFQGLDAIMESAFKETFHASKGGQYLIIKDVHRGKYSIIFPEATGKRVLAFCELLRENTKKYFIKNKIEDVFIALGILSYSSKEQIQRKQQDFANLSIKEIYIGSETRLFKRINYKTKIEITVSDGEGLVSETIDLSQGGVCFMSPRPFKTDAEIRVRMNLLKKKKSIEAGARVAWIKKVERLPKETIDQYKIGAEFTTLSVQDKGILGKELKLYYE